MGCWSFNAFFRVDFLYDIFDFLNIITYVHLHKEFCFEQLLIRVRFISDTRDIS